MNDRAAAASHDCQPLRALEFYSGIGGMHYALQSVVSSTQVAAAFEISDVANDVYELNFGFRPCQGNIQTVSAKKLDALAAQLWLLSPPCQPYTRRGLKLDAQDPRAASFLHLLSLLETMQRPPDYLLVENVVGFETSETRSIMTSKLARLDFDIEEFVLSPLQLGIPYSRPRYFCLARQHKAQHSAALQQPNAKSPSTSHLQQAQSAPALGRAVSSEQEATCSTIPEDGTLQNTACPHRDRTPFHNEDSGPAGSRCPDADNLAPTKADPSIARAQVPEAVIRQAGMVFDIVTPQSRRCNCFTKTYSQYAKGSGSVLATQATHLLRSSAAPDEAAAETMNEPRVDRVDVREVEGETLEDTMLRLHLRYFTPREIANLHSFPAEFSFPDHISLKQQRRAQQFLTSGVVRCVRSSVATPPTSPVGDFTSLLQQPGDLQGFVQACSLGFEGSSDRQPALAAFAGTAESALNFLYAQNQGNRAHYSASTLVSILQAGACDTSERPGIYLVFGNLDPEDKWDKDPQPIRSLSGPEVSDSSSAIKKRRH
ncbi:hypothetical protein WJX73_001977 [Symbiochloris irregularis]|uniref:Uncharacterized protein n=1 Tax=Symbiochloris irregularis TaxID=706552 RepID=A0AAW1PD65_9CHLO